MSYSYFNERIPWPDHIVQNKEQNARYYARYMLARLTEMFEYDGLPKTIEKRYMLLQLYTNGSIFVMQKPETTDLYSFVGGWGGEPNAYYVPTIYTVANPYLKFSGQYKIGKDGVLIYNDSTASGLLPIIMRYSELLAENDISLRLASINARRRTIISGSDDNARAGAVEYLKQIEEGKLGSVISDPAFLDGIKAQPDGMVASGRGAITELIELEQYLRATMYNELGLNANYNMKREAINSNESQLNKDALHPLIDNMLAEQKKGWDAVNDMFGTSISVSLNSAWLDNEIEKQANLDLLAANVENIEKSAETPENGQNNDQGGTDNE